MCILQVMIWFQNKRMRVKALRKKAGLGPEEIDPDELPTHMQKRNKSDPKGPQVGTEQVMSPGRQVPSPSSFNAPVTSGPGIHNNTMPMPVAPVQNMGPPQNPGIGNQQMTDVHNSVTGNAGFTGMLGDAGGGVEFNNTGVMGNKLQPIGNDLTPSKAQNNPVPLPPMAATNVNQNTAIPSTPAPHQAVNATMNAPMPMNRSPHPKNPPAYNMPQQPPPDYVNNPQAMASLPSPRQLTNEALQFHKQDLKNKIVARSRRLSEASNKSDDSTHSAQPGMNVGSQVPFKTMTTLTSFPTPHHRLGPIAPSGSFPAPIPRPVFTSSPQPPPERFPGHYPYAGEGLLSYLSGMLPPLLPPYQTRPPMVSESTWRLHSRDHRTVSLWFLMRNIMLMTQYCVLKTGYGPTFHHFLFIETERLEY